MGDDIPFCPIDTDDIQKFHAITEKRKGIGGNHLKHHTGGIREDEIEMKKCNNYFLNCLSR